MMRQPRHARARRAAAAGRGVPGDRRAAAAAAVGPSGGVVLDRVRAGGVRRPRVARRGAAARRPAAPIHAVWAWLPGAHGPFATVGVLVDAQSTTMLLLVTLVALLVQVYSLGYLHDEPAPALGRYYAFQSLFAFSMMGVVLAPNLLQLFICWELVGVCSYLLIGFWYRKPEAARAALKAFWTTKAGRRRPADRHRPAAARDRDVRSRRAAPDGGDGGLIPLAGLGVITFCIYLGAMGKSAQFPLHVWLPDAMEGPTPVSALIHAATMVTAGVYLLTRTRVAVRADAGRARDRRLDRRVHGAAGGGPRVRADRHQARARVLDRVAARLHDGGDRRGLRGRRLPAPADARHLQGAAVPRRRRGDPRRRQQRHVATWAASRGRCRRRRSSS